MEITEKISYATSKGGGAVITQDNSVMDTAHDLGTVVGIEAGLRIMTLYDYIQTMKTTGMLDSTTDISPGPLHSAGQ